MSILLVTSVIISRYGHFSGINRKIQMKYQPHGFQNASSADEGEF